MSDTQPIPALARDDRRHSISAKIIFLVFLCTFSTALVISWIAIQSIHGQLRAQIERDFPAALERSRGRLGVWLDAGTQALRELRGRSTRPSQRFADVLADFAADCEQFDAVGVVGGDGAWLLPIPELRGAKVPIDDASGPRRLALVREDGAVPVLLLPIRKGDPATGFLVARYDASVLRGLLDAQRQGTRGALLLTDAVGRVLAAAGTDDAAPRRDALHALEQLAAGEPGRIREYASEDGVHVLGASLPLHDPDDWHLLVESSFATAFAPVLSVVAEIFVIDLLIILVFVAFAYRITTRMLGPIEDLSEGARRASRGDLGLAISDPGTHDEIGLLTRSFNEMMARLKQSQHDLQEANRQLTTRNDELQRANEVLSQLSITDGLTKLHNHRYFQESLTRELKRQSRNEEPLSILLVDLDDFKALNDRLGHASGDELLVRVASIMAATVRESDLLARYGGEEFVVLATDTDLEGAVALAEKIRMSVEQTPHIVNESLRPVRITVSVGVAEYRGDRRRFFEAADRALYRAKDQGKNCVVSDEPE